MNQKKNTAKKSAKLDNAKTVRKTYLSITNKFLSDKKICITPLVVNGKLVPDFKQKAIFNNHLAFNVCLLKIIVNYQTLIMKLKKD